MRTKPHSTVFDFVWSSPDQQPKEPLLYGKIEVLLPDRIAEGRVERILKTERPEGQPSRYTLRLSVDADLTRYSPLELVDVGVRVL